MKRLIFFLSALLLLMPTCAAYAAQYSPEIPWIEEARDDFCYYKDYYLSEEIEDYFYDAGRLLPGGQIRFFIGEDDFYWDEYVSNNRPLTMTQAWEQGLSIGYDISGDTGVVSGVAFSRMGGAASVLVTLSEQYTGQRSADFSISLHLVRDGESIDFTDLDIDGIVRPAIISADRTYRLIDASKGQVIYANESCTTQIYAGNGFVLKAPLQMGAEYQAKAVAQADYADTAFYKKYNIPEVCYLYTHNFAQGEKLISIDAPRIFDVYGNNDSYIGTTADPLPVQRVYRLAEQRPAPDPITNEPDNITGGGGDNPVGGGVPEAVKPVQPILALSDFSENCNYNPVTGR